MVVAVKTLVVVMEAGLTAIVKVFVVVGWRRSVWWRVPSNQGVSATAVVGSEKGGEEFPELEVIREF